MNTETIERNLKEISEEIRQMRIDTLINRIPAGTFCDETNNCGGYLTAEETDELEKLLKERNK